MSQVLARMTPSPQRRVFAIALMGFLGLTFLYTGIYSGPEGLTLRIVLTVFGGAALWQAVRTWQAGVQGLELTEEGVFDLTGRLICPLDNIEKVESGMLALKPSNGLTLKLVNPMPQGWVPGLWWRYGKRLGLGGATPSHQGKQMAEMLTVLLHQRAQGSGNG